MRGYELRKIFDGADGYHDYVANLLINAQPMREIYRELECAAALPPVFAAGSRILVLCEAYCADCIINLPLLARLAEACTGTALRVASRDRHLHVAKRFPGSNGASRVPTVILLDADWQPVAYWSERSEADHRWFADFVERDPFPGIILNDGEPAGAFAPWLQRRLEAQTPVFTSQNWHHVRNELHDLGKRYVGDHAFHRGTDDRAGARAPIHG